MSEGKDSIIIDRLLLILVSLLIFKGLDSFMITLWVDHKLDLYNPFADIPFWVRNIMVVAGMGLSCAILIMSAGTMRILSTVISSIVFFSLAGLAVFDYLYGLVNIGW